MIWPAVLSGAALRVVRTAAGRRALHGVLLAGGLFALGFLCGERAHAAETTPSRATASTSAPAPAPAPASAQAPDTVSASDGSSLSAAPSVPSTRHRPARAGRTMAVHRAPAGDPDGVQAGRSAPYDVTPQYGEAPVVPMDRRLPPWSVSGPTAGAGATGGTGGRQQDIPVSPA